MKSLTLFRQNRIFVSFAMVCVILIALMYGYRKDIKDAYTKYTVVKTLEGFSTACFKRFPATTATDKIRTLRHCVNIYSQYSDSVWNEPIWHNRVGTARWLVSRAEGKQSVSPPMECYYRARILNRALTAIGITSHKFTVIMNSDDFNDHVVLEVLNPDTGQKEVHDPTYDMDFRDLKNMDRLDISSMLAQDFLTYAPCNFEGNCGWDIVSRENLSGRDNQVYWNAAYQKTEKTLYINPARFDLTKVRPVHGKPMTFCQKREGWCDKVIKIQSEP